MTQSVFTKALEPYILRLNVADNAVAVGLVFNALEDPGVFVFGEILDHPRVQALKGYFPSGNAYYQLLKIFAFGCFRDYLVGSSKLPSLTPKMVKKLRMLTIVTLATKARVIKYCELQRELVSLIKFKICELKFVQYLNDFTLEKFFADVCL